MGLALPQIWYLLTLAFDVAGAIAAATLAIWIWPRRDSLGQAGTAIVLALLLTAIWCIAQAASHGNSFGAAFAESVRNLAWLIVIYRLFASDGRHASLAPIRPVVIALAFVEVLHLALGMAVVRLPLDWDITRTALNVIVMFRLLVTVGGLVLVHNLYAGASRDVRPALRWPTAALAVMFVFDLNLYTIAYLGGHWPVEFAAARGLATIAMVGLLAIGASKGRDVLRLRPSRAVTFQTFSLLLIGVYLVAMVGVAQWLSYAGGDFARLVELGFLTIASATAVLVLPSKRMRGWFKVALAKHLFQHRYDYREEWLRFTRTIGNSGSAAMPLGERVVQAVADIADCPAGLLLTAGDHGDLTLAARWNWPEIAVPATAFPTKSLGFFERENFIVDLDDIRAGHDDRGETDHVPAWLVADSRAWALVPLIHYERLVGIVVLARSAVKRGFDWEDFDLLRVVGQQLASYLAENASQEALAEARRFDDFHRRIAFVMHDIKNLASQLSLLARNAELHAEKKEFRDDMLLTLRNSADKLNALLARLSRYGTGAVERLEQVSTRDVTASVMAMFHSAPQVTLTENQDLTITANRHSLEQVLVHLVQNGIDASAPGEPVFLSVAMDGLGARFEIVDSGCGMSPEFVRTRLFKPFVSTKNGGFGIGAFEARELVRAMRGRLEVESREGLGSRFVVRIPLSATTDVYQNFTSNEQRVA
ncbi:XrtA/PEP-CTERM system histidine kinase PrsK [Novosphingobium album (ex Liu et al. 2023)]|uniref:histidine kinase n=1 Tax=Novosphingobium album (ex Liu et al. 2023) TaxID=3031130 RepID=A0ABT5WLX4_9SPHN|nr:XrtA/PEP-CTERM system histidine kinase PrsK [Novosphingobium album (ex Liu et al. 2023)]MDE8651030.1 PEP-CTERM system histidine kinase PrsK [Novosphingobium album (ex Liu et al. 2023)]